MVQAETRYTLFRKLFNKKPKAKPGIVLPESPGTCSEDEIERAKVRKIQLALKAKRNHEIQHRELEKKPESRYVSIVTHTIFGALLTLTFGAFFDLIYVLFIFDRNPSDPLDVFRSVVCDDDGCTVRSKFDVEPPSTIGVLIWLVFGLWSLRLSVRNFFGTDERGAVIHLISAFIFGLGFIIKREQLYTLGRESL